MAPQDFVQVVDNCLGLTEEQAGLLMENLRVSLDLPGSGDSGVSYPLLLLLLFEVILCSPFATSTANVNCLFHTFLASQ